MSEYTCEICKRKFNQNELEYTNDTEKCILHCSKDAWYEIKFEYKDWTKSKDRINYFWNRLRQIISNEIKDEPYQKGSCLNFQKTIFPIFEKKEQDIQENPDGTISILDWNDNFVDISTPNKTIEDNCDYSLNIRFDFSYSEFLDDANFNYYTFKDFVNFDYVKFHGECSFKNVEFNKVSFNEINFFKPVIFEKSILNFRNYQQVEDFKNTIFHDDVKFYNLEFSTNKNEKAFDIKFISTQFKRIYIMGCNFKKGICFFRDTKADSIDINSTVIDFLYIESDVPNIRISNNNKEINKLTIKHNTLKSLTIHNTIVKKDFLLNKDQYKKRDTFDLDLLNLKESTFEGKVKIQFYDIKDASFYNTKFQDLADFYQTIFHKVDFERTDFWKISVFSEAHFKCNVAFDFVKFWGKAVFRDTIIEGHLNLRDSIFNDEANFLNITKEKVDKDREPIDINVANRETARVIKNFYDNSNNVIESNRFYKLEMEQRENELDKNIKSNIIEWLIFKFHKLSSNHSQDALLSFIWILSISFFYLTICSINENLEYFNDKLVFHSYNVIFLLIMFGLFDNSLKINNFVKFLYVHIFQFGFLIFIQKEFILYNIYNRLSDAINPFSIMNSWDKITIDLLLFKIVIAYLIYQLIISVRQNTRRK